MNHSLITFSKEKLNINFHGLFIKLSALTLLLNLNVSAQKLTDRALDFTIFTQEDVTLIGTEVEGRVAVGGNLILKNSTYQIIPNTAGGFKVGGIPISLAVRGGVEFNGGMLQVNQDKAGNSNYVKIGNPDSPEPLQASYAESQFWVRNTGDHDGQIFINASPTALGVSESNNPIFENVFGTESGKIDIDGAFRNFIATSQALKALPHSVVMKDFDNASIQKTGPFLSKNGLPSKPKFILDPNGINVLTISGEVWSSFNNDVRFEGFQTNQSKEFVLIINIVNADGDVRFGSLPDLQNNKGHVVINFPDSESTITLKGNGQIDGIIFAPRARVVKANPANLVGQIIAREFVHDGHEIHYQPLESEWYEKAIQVEAETLCDKDAPYLTYSITANFEIGDLLAKIEWLAPDGTVVETLENQPLQNTILFPGAEVNEDGKGIAWPGWTIVDGKWTTIDDLNSKLRLDGSKIRVTVNPIFLADFYYPQSTLDCFTNPPPSETTLPVRLTSFSVSTTEQNTAALSWTVEDAINFSHFEVEKSVDGFVFSKLADVRFNADNSRYRFADRTLNSGLNFYRLKMVDLDGSSEYSNVESIKFTAISEPLAYGFPNPFSNSLSVYAKETMKASVYDATGREITTLQLDAGRNQIEAGGWPSGLYLIRTGNKETIRLIKK